jgi:hypothetical protein
METQASIVAGALFDFCGFLTTRFPPFIVGSTEQVYPVHEALEVWAKERKLELGGADVMRWQQRINPES